jgi:hypothetical protein
MENAVPKKTQYLVPSLQLVEETPDESSPSEKISYLLKQRAGSTGTNAPTYKMYVHRFQEGTVQEWIKFRENLEEIWTQNSVENPKDRMATVRAILRGESLTCFNAKMQDIATESIATETTTSATNVDVMTGIHAVAETVFPHRALAHQKRWMLRGLKKPKELSFRKTAVALGRLNNSLPLFPNASTADKFTDEEIVEILEWAIPQHWRSKFDLDGYVPTDFLKPRLVTECEILERSESQKSSQTGLNTKKTKDQAHKKGNVSKYKKDNSSDKKQKFYCTEHGANPTHNTESCYVLKSKAKKNDSATMTKKSFRREINLLSAKRPKKKVLEMYAAVLKEERAKTTKPKPKASKARKHKKKVEFESSSSSESESEEEIHTMDVSERFSKKFKSKNGSIESNESPENTAYDESIATLGESRDTDMN